ncbi:MAG TPA: alpha/beta hydrolase [Kofleriaceae bacterium]|jgi:pimeloyl-ACP methyl ester carboxylesterase
MTLADFELHEIERANASGLRPVVFVHGLWLLPSSWQRWRALFEEHGYTTLAPGWPDDPETVEEARAHPERFAGKSLHAISAHYADAIGRLARKPAIVGHSFGGTLTQMLAGEGRADASVAIDPAPFRGVLPLPFSSLKSAAPVLANPANRDRAKSLTFEQFTYGWANNLDAAEARALFEEFHVAGPGRPLFQAAFSNFDPRSEDKVNTENPDRGPMLLVSGEHDHTVPWAVVHAEYEKQARNPGVTDLAIIQGRGHSLVIDHGWREVALVALDFLRQHAPS